MWRGAVVAILGGGFWWLWSYTPGPQPRFASSGLVGQGLGGKGLEIAGSGSNLPLMRLWVRAFRKATGAPARLHGSIGSTGGIRAVYDGAIGLGLLSRDLRSKERRWGLRILPYAKVAVVVAAHGSVPVKGLTRAQLLELYQGRRHRWSNGVPVVVWLRERGDSSHEALSRVWPAFERVDREAHRRHRWRVLYRDRAMQEALLHTRGAVGLLDLGAIKAQALPLKCLSIDGVAPSLQALAAGRYPFSKVLSFAYRPPLRGWAARFVDFAFSAQGRKITRRSGYLPLERKP